MTNPLHLWFMPTPKPDLNLNRIEQVEDDLALLDLMLEDMGKASRLYQPTNYWKHYERGLLPELRTQGLHDFRRRPKSILKSFGAVDLFPRDILNVLQIRLLYNKFVLKVPGWKKLMEKFASSSTRWVVNRPNWYQRVSMRNFRRVEQIGQESRAFPLGQFQFSLAGNPEDVFWVEGKPFTDSMLYYYLRYAYVAKHVDFNSTQVVVELGAGSGKNIEILAKAHPHLTILNFDIAPQLYVTEQYLKKALGDRVVSYRNTRNLDVQKLESGKVYCLGAWDFPILANLKVDLFWNSASFQEMEPDVVLNYLQYVNVSASQVYLMEKFDGKEVAKSEAHKGVLKPILLEHYQQGLSDFKLIHRQDCMYPSGKKLWFGYQDSIWKK